MTDYTFHPVYVDPYYLLLMNANFVREPKRVTELFNGLKKIEKELDNIQLTHMLRASWRPSKVAAWIIGLHRKMELEDELINVLHKNPIYCEHLIFALSLLNTEKSIDGIEKHIQLQTDSLKVKFDILRIETMRFESALVALGWLDKQNKTNRAEKSLQVWGSFKKDVAIYEKKYRRFNIDEYVRIDDTMVKFFDEAMSIAKTYNIST